VLHCTACRSALSPFAQYRPTVDKACPKCGAELRIHRRGRREQEIEGPALPPVPALVSVEREEARPGSYRERGRAEMLRLRWRDPLSGRGRLYLGFAGLTTAVGVAGSVLFGPMALAIGAPVSLAYGAASMPRAGELVLDADRLLARQRWSRPKSSLPRSEIRAVRVVEIPDPQGSFPSTFRVLAGLSSSEWVPVARPVSTVVAHYLAASLRQALEVGTE